MDQKNQDYKSKTMPTKGITNVTNLPQEHDIESAN